MNANDTIDVDVDAISATLAVNSSNNAIVLTKMKRQRKKKMKYGLLDNLKKKCIGRRGRENCRRISLKILWLRLLEGMVMRSGRREPLLEDFMSTPNLAIWIAAHFPRQQKVMPNQNEASRLLVSGKFEDMARL